jgi:hypothetical protein
MVDRVAMSVVYRDLVEVTGSYRKHVFSARLSVINYSSRAVLTQSIIHLGSIHVRTSSVQQINMIVKDLSKHFFHPRVFWNSCEYTSLEMKTPMLCARNPPK